MDAPPIAAEAHIDRPLARTVGSTIFEERKLAEAIGRDPDGRPEPAKASV